MKSILEALQYPTPTSWSSLSCAFRPCSLGLEQFRLVKLSLFRTAKQKEKKETYLFFSVSEKSRKELSLFRISFCICHMWLTMLISISYLSHVSGIKKKSALFDMVVASVSGAATRLSDSYLKPPPAALSAVSCAEPLLAEPLSAEAALGEHCR